VQPQLSFFLSPSAGGQATPAPAQWQTRMRLSSDWQESAGMGRTLLLQDVMRHPPVGRLSLRKCRPAPCIERRGDAEASSRSGVIDSPDHDSHGELGENSVRFELSRGRRLCHEQYEREVRNV
jgi:hypothetical protein